MALFNKARDRAPDPGGPVPDVLNPNLYRRMAARYGSVKVFHHRVPLAGAYAPDPVTGAPALVVVTRGETYAACCPFCGDGRTRMWVNHMFGVYDPTLGRPLTELWKCYNTECQTDYENRRDLTDELVLAFDRYPPTRLRVVQAVPTELEPVEFPGALVPVAELAPAHPARAYLERVRGFDAGELTRVWGVAFAAHVPPRTRGSAALGRIVIPVRRAGALVGWQARYVGDVDWKRAGVPKYLTFFPKSMAVYGIDEADSCPYLAVAEGPTDAWRHGPGCVSTLGKGGSPVQAGIVGARALGRPVVYAPDNDDPDSAPKFAEFARAVTRYQRAHLLPVSPTAVFLPPPGADPGALTGPALRAAVAVAAARAGAPGT